MESPAALMRQLAQHDATVRSLGEEAATAAAHPERLRDAESALARIAGQQGIPAARHAASLSPNRLPVQSMHAAHVQWSSLSINTLRGRLTTAAFWP